MRAKRAKQLRKAIKTLGGKYRKAKREYTRMSAPERAGFIKLLTVPDETIIKELEDVRNNNIQR